MGHQVTCTLDIPVQGAPNPTHSSPASSFPPSICSSLHLIPPLPVWGSWLLLYLSHQSQLHVPSVQTQRGSKGHARRQIRFFKIHFLFWNHFRFTEKFLSITLAQFPLILTSHVTMAHLSQLRSQCWQGNSKLYTNVLFRFQDPTKGTTLVCF